MLDLAAEIIFGNQMFEILAFAIAIIALIFSRKALNKLREAEARIALLEDSAATQRTIVVAAPPSTEAPLAPTIAPEAGQDEPSAQTWIRTPVAPEAPPPL